MFYVIGEQIYKNSIWYKTIFDGLMAEKRKKRFSLTVLESVQEIESLCVHSEDAVFVLGADSSWLKKTVLLCSKLFDNRVIVLGNHEGSLDGGKYSIVTADIAHDIGVLYGYLKAIGKNRIAMYGINPDSASDDFKKESFLAQGACEEDLFYNSDTLDRCYESFLKRLPEYDGVICVNDYVAISLIRHLGINKRPYITSCGGTMLSRLFSPSITHMRIDYGSFGKVGVELCGILVKNKNINSVNVRLAGTFAAGETTDFCALDKPRVAAERPRRADDKFYSDREVSEMIRVESMLNSCSGQDLRLIEMVLENSTYQRISDELFISTNGVKYKLKNMFEVLNVKTKREFIDMLKRYITL